MGVLTVVIAPAGRLAGVRDTLQDWSGAGLIDRFLWIEPSMVSRDEIAALDIDGGRLDGITLQSLAGRERFDRIRVAVLVPALAGVVGVPGAIEQSVAHYLEESFGETPVTRVRAIVSRVGETRSVPGLVVEGWHNIVLSPEDAIGPGVGSKPLRVTRDVHDLGVHAAAALAGLIGLWTGIGASPLDDEQLLPGKMVRLHRSFYRRLGTSALEASLRRQVLSMADRLPLPTQSGESTVYIEDVPLATRVMSDQLWERHAHVLRGPRETAGAAPYTRISALEAFKMFFTFLGAAIRNSPRAWVAGVLNNVRGTTAAAVHNLVFGSAPSAYAVVVKGVTAEGLPASWIELTEAATTLDKLLEDRSVPREHVVHQDMSALWKDYAAAALTLADAGERVSGMPPVQVGMRRGVLQKASFAVPRADQVFDGIPPHLAASVGTSNVAPFDVLGTATLENSLRTIAEQASTGLAASTAIQALGAWKASHHDSFAVTVGLQIGERLHAVTAEIRSLLGQIKQAASADGLLAGIQAKQKRLAKILQILSILAVVGLGIVGGMYALEALESSDALTSAGVIAAVWLLSAFTIFVLGQRDLFALINARRELLSREESARGNLRHALVDARRLGDAYGQFLAWSTVIGELLDSPFGHPGGTEKAEDVELSDLPLSVGLGTANVDDVVLASTANDIRRGIFSVGWLTASWDAAIANAHRQIGPRGNELQSRPDSIFAARGDGPDSLLPLWVAALLNQGIDRTIGDEHWARILLDLENGRQNLADGLLAHVVDSRNGDTPVTYDDFMSRVDDPALGVPDRLNDALLTDSARSTGLSRVLPTSPRVCRSGLGRTVCLSQLSDGIPAYELLAYEPEDAPSWIDHAPGRDRISDAGRGEPAALVPLPDLFDGAPF